MGAGRELKAAVDDTADMKAARKKAGAARALLERERQEAERAAIMAEQPRLRREFYARRGMVPPT